ncbi:MAG: recombinase family protein, partial [Fusobacteriaceae bacterium]
MKVVAYCRYSSDNQREESIQAQLRAIREFCEKEKHTLVETYVDEAQSGKSTNDRVAFNKMIDDSKNNNFDGVLVHKL